ncbi:MAG: hypothetical protein IJ702_05625, partial [Fretibacterium sp.]|nr:hypothetical protein [Fretibacterium sp.]
SSGSAPIEPAKSSPKDSKASKASSNVSSKASGDDSTERDAEGAESDADEQDTTGSVAEDGGENGEGEAESHSQDGGQPEQSSMGGASEDKAGPADDRANAASESSGGSQGKAAEANGGEKAGEKGSSVGSAEIVGERVKDGVMVDLSAQPEKGRVEFTYTGSLDMEATEGKDGGSFSLLVDRNDPQKSVGIGAHSRRDDEEGYEAILSKKHEGRDANGNKYFTADSRDGSYFCVAYPELGKYWLVDMSPGIEKEDFAWVMKEND